MLNLTPVLMAVGGFLAFRAVARSRSYVRVGADGVRVRNYPRKALLLPLDQVDRFDTTGSSRVVLVRRDGTTMGLMGLSRRPSRTPTMLNNEVAAAGNVPVDAGVVTQEAHPDPPEIRSRMAVLAHLGIVVLAVVVPLVVLLTARPGDQFTRAHARSAMNFQGTFLIVWIVLGGIMFNGQAFDGQMPVWLYPTMLLVGGAAVTVSVMGAARAAKGESWRYPFAIPFVRQADPTARLNGPR